MSYLLFPEWHVLLLVPPVIGKGRQRISDLMSATDWRCAALTKTKDSFTYELLRLTFSSSSLCLSREVIFRRVKINSDDTRH